jgi:hypothetical protein
MKTISHSSFSTLKDENLIAKLNSLIRQVKIQQIHYQPHSEKTPAHLTFITETNKEAELIQAQKWIQNLYKNHHILPHILSQNSTEHLLKQGIPTIAFYTTPISLIYQPNTDNSFVKPNWKTLQKRFKNYTSQFYHDHDILLSQANRFQKKSAYISVYMSYLSILEHNILCLEQLYIGTNNSNLNLHVRITIMANYLKPIQIIFLKKDQTKYYLIEELQKANTLSEEDELYINYDLYNSIKDAESKIYELISTAFKQINKKLKVHKKSNSQTIAIKTEECIEQEHLISLITKIHTPEEIYLFHKTETQPNQTTYYLLLIGPGISNQLLSQIQQYVKEKTSNKVTVVLIAHTRIWIQQNLYAYQEFFQAIMNQNNRIFTSNNYPQIHWLTPFTSCYPDLEYYYKSAQNSTKQFFTLKKHANKQYHEGLMQLFATAIIKILRTYIYATTSYLPNYLTAETLWQLCLYTDPKLKNHEYLFNQFKQNHLFKNITAHLRFNHKITQLSKKEQALLSEILKSINKKLTKKIESKSQIKQ